MLDYINSHRGDLQFIVSLILGLAMWRLGGGPERASATVFLGLIILPVAAFRIMFDSTLMWGSYASLYIIFDGLAAIAFLWIALNANRNYPLFLAGLQLVAISAHGVRLLGDVVSPLAYTILAVGPSYGQLLVMIIGLVRHGRRKRAFGAYRGWRIGHEQPQIASVFSSWR